jgi:hypothetical protein
MHCGFSHFTIPESSWRPLHTSLPHANYDSGHAS